MCVISATPMYILNNHFTVECADIARKFNHIMMHNIIMKKFEVNTFYGIPHIIHCKASNYNFDCNKTSSSEYHHPNQHDM